MNKNKENYKKKLLLIREKLDKFLGESINDHFLKALNLGDYFDDLDEYLQGKKESFSDMLFRLIDEKHLKDSEVYKQAGIDRRLFSKIRSDKMYRPSKKTAILLCLGLKLSYGEAIELLKTAGYTLSDSFEFDMIISFMLENKEYDVQFINYVLEDYGHDIL